MSRDLTYTCPGATAPAQEEWSPAPAGFRRHEAITVIGRGEVAWQAAARAVLRWEVKTRSGFSLLPLPPEQMGPPEQAGPAAPWQERRHRPQERVQLRWSPRRLYRYRAAAGRRSASTDPDLVVEGQDRTVLARLGPLVLREPVRVVAVVDTDHRAGFAYGTRAGHPVSGEEAWIVSRDAHGVVRLTTRSLTAAAPGIRALMFPPALLLQPRYRRRYLRALAAR